jgi:hypothetical protein
LELLFLRWALGQLSAGEKPLHTASSWARPRGVPRAHFSPAPNSLAPHRISIFSMCHNFTTFNYKGVRIVRGPARTFFQRRTISHLITCRIVRGPARTFSSAELPRTS